MVMLVPPLGGVQSSQEYVKGAVGDRLLTNACCEGWY